jgi:chromosome segregation ATPase
MFRVLLIPNRSSKIFDASNMKRRSCFECDSTILQELRNEIAAAKPTADETKVTVDETKKDSADAQDAASDAQRDATSAQDAASDAKNAVDSVQSTIADSVSGLSAIDSEAVKRDVRCVKYEMKKLKRKAKETVPPLFQVLLHRENGGHCSLLSADRRRIL